jgi:hypothetical protein
MVLKDPHIIAFHMQDNAFLKMNLCIHMTNNTFIYILDSNSLNTSFLNITLIGITSLRSHNIIKCDDIVTSGETSFSERDTLFLNIKLYKANF